MTGAVTYKHSFQNAAGQNLRPRGVALLPMVACLQLLLLAFVCVARSSRIAAPAVGLRAPAACHAGAARA